VVDESERFETLVGIMDRLREPGGCPWDREQTYESLRSYLIEECYEVAEALDRGDGPALKEELGDLLLQIVFLSRLAKEDGEFTVDDVVRSIVDKMIRRHPHVFGTETADNSDQVLKHWEEIKRREKADAPGATGPGSVLAGIPQVLPALLKAQRLGTKAARVGFDWNDSAGVMEKIDEELAELRAAVDRGEDHAAGAELGDLLFSIVNLARHLEIDPEGALERTNLKFRRRFEWIESYLSSRGEGMDGTDLDVLERLWAKAKVALEDADGAG
jgi:MazG family protein